MRSAVNRPGSAITSGGRPAAVGSRAGRTVSVAMDGCLLHLWAVIARPWPPYGRIRVYMNAAAGSDSDRVRKPEASLRPVIRTPDAKRAQQKSRTGTQLPDPAWVLSLEGTKPFSKTETLCGRVIDGFGFDESKLTQVVPMGPNRGLSAWALDTQQAAHERTNVQSIDETITVHVRLADAY